MRHDAANQKKDSTYVTKLMREHADSGDFHFGPCEYGPSYLVLWGSASDTATSLANNRHERASHDLPIKVLPVKIPERARMFLVATA